MYRHIFISYSRKDSSEAIDLAERLRAEGMTIWIDREGIGGATQWAGEIAAAIRDCSFFLVLLSENAVESANVLKEVSLASERGKRILPVVLRRTPLPVSLEYHLAGIQHLFYSDYPAILSSLKGASGVLATGGPLPKFAEDRKTLLVFPFEDLSPSQDNGWFADGLTGELITTLSKIKSLHIIDRVTSMGFKGARARTRDIARELHVRYFLDGNVRMFGDQIKIAVALLDIETGEYLWHDSHKGVFADIFEIQENVAKKVFEGLKLTWTLEEEKNILTWGTENIAAYEYYLKASNAYNMWTHDRMKSAIELSEYAIKLDPQFAEALRLKANALVHLYRLWERNIVHLREAESLFLHAQSLKPLLKIASGFVMLYCVQKRFSEAEEIVNKETKENPNDFYSHFLAGYYYYNSGQLDKAFEAYRNSLTFRPDYRMSHWNLIEALDRSQRNEECAQWAFRAIPIFERWVVLHPEDQFGRAQYALLLQFAGHAETALSTIASIMEDENADGLSLYTAATLFLHRSEEDTAATLFDRAIARGFSDIELLTNDPHFKQVESGAKFQSVLERLRRKIDESGFKEIDESTFGTNS